MSALKADVGDSAYREVSTPVDVQVALRELMKDRRCDALAVIGGDGTTQAVLTALHAMMPSGAWPLLIPLPGGSTNMTALDLGASDTLSGTLATLRRWYAGGGTEGKRVIRPLLKVERPGHVPLCGMFFGAASVAAGVGFFRGRLRGVAAPSERTSLFSILRMLFSFARGADVGARQVSGRVDDHERFDRLVTVCVAGTVNRFLLGLRPYWGREGGPIHFTLVDQHARAFWSSLWRVGTGRPGQRLTPERGYLSHNAYRVELSFDGPFAVDGELFEARSADGPVVLTAPRMVEWMVPT